MPLDETKERSIIKTHNAPGSSSTDRLIYFTLTFILYLSIHMNLQCLSLTQ